MPLADATGCAHVVRLDAAGLPLPVDSLATPAFVRIQSIVVHFSTYAVVIVTPTDNIPPALSGVPANMTLISSVPLAVTWPAPSASDAVSGILPVTCTPASGSLFLLGTTAVSCSATDISGNTATGSFSITVQAPPPTATGKSIEPKLECVKANAGGSFTARFGYDNSNKMAVTIPVGPNNTFTPLPADRGQTTTFLPKRQKNTFAVDFDGNRLTWTLKGPNGKTRSISATRLSDRCR